MIRCAFMAACAAVVIGAAGSASAGVYSTTINQNLFGSNYNISIFRVGPDTQQGQSPAAGRLEPEGMVWYDGSLYVSGDGTATETNGYLARYDGGNLFGLPQTYGQFTATVGSNTAAFGPEGLAVNTRGSGYGSFSGSTPRLVAGDNVISPVSARVLGAMNITNNTLENQIGNFPVNADDVSFVPGASAAQDRFLFIDGTAVLDPITLSSTNQLVWYSASDMTFQANAFTVPDGAKGLLYLSAADAALFSPNATSDSVLISFTGSPNVLRLYSLDGTLLASQTLPTLSNTVGRFGGVESLAFDPVTKRLFLGDEQGASSQIAVFTIPAPGAALGLGMLALAARRRRA